MGNENEDLDYNFASDVLSPPDTKKDPDVQNVPALQVVLADVNALIAEHNTFDVLDVGSTRMELKQQIEAHKIFVKYMRQFKAYLEGKIKELQQ